VIEHRVHDVGREQSTLLSMKARRARQRIKDVGNLAAVTALSTQPGYDALVERTKTADVADYRFERRRHVPVSWWQEDRGA
jgi:hypothetical protein